MLLSIFVTLILIKGKNSATEKTVFWIVLIVATYGCVIFLKGILESHEKGWEFLIPGIVILTGGGFVLTAIILLSGNGDSGSALPLGIIIALSAMAYVFYSNIRVIGLFDGVVVSLIQTSLVIFMMVLLVIYLLASKNRKFRRW